jgi:hypothetical protein
VVEPPEKQPHHHRLAEFKRVNNWGSYGESQQRQVLDPGTIAGGTHSEVTIRQHSRIEGSSDPT